MRSERWRWGGAFSRVSTTALQPTIPRLVSAEKCSRCSGRASERGPIKLACGTPRSTSAASSMSPATPWEASMNRIELSGNFKLFILKYLRLSTWGETDRHSVLRRSGGRCNRILADSSGVPAALRSGRMSWRRSLDRREVLCDNMVSSRDRFAPDRRFFKDLQ